MKALLLSIRTILRFRTYTAINVLGLALSTRSAPSIILCPKPTGPS